MATSYSRASLLVLVAMVLVVQVFAARHENNGPIVFPIKCSHPRNSQGEQISVECPFIAGSTTKRNGTVCRPLCPNPDEVGRCKGRTCRCCTTGV